MRASGVAPVAIRGPTLLRPDRPFSRAFENLIVLSVASVIMEATPGLPA
jgi:hypothetical protein